MKAPGVEITTKIAKFGSISYQVANIGSVSVYTARKINPVAAIMVLIGISAGVCRTIRTAKSEFINFVQQHSNDTTVDIRCDRSR